MTPPSIDALLAEGALRCPAGGGSLELQGDSLVAVETGAIYPLVDGVPVLLSERSLFAVEEIRRNRAEGRSRGGFGRALRRLVPRDSRNHGTRENLARLGELLHAAPHEARPRVLVIGGGELGEGMEPIVGDERIECLETDVYVGPRTMLVCDGHELPFSDGTFDAVICQAVLEHVLSPERVVGEIHRVLRPGGLVYSEIPFMQQVHEGAHDFTRYTMSGHRRLFRRFDEIAAGVVCGPGMALAWAIRYFVLACVGDSRRARQLAGSAVRFLTWWLPLLDRVLVRRRGAVDGASGTAFLGRRRDGAVPDREIVDSYTGLVEVRSR